MEGKACREGRAQAGARASRPRSLHQAAVLKRLRIASPGGSELKGDYNPRSLGCVSREPGAWMPWTCRWLLTCLCSHPDGAPCAVSRAGTAAAAPSQFHWQAPYTAVWHLPGTALPTGASRLYPISRETRMREGRNMT